MDKTFSILILYSLTLLCNSCGQTEQQTSETSSGSATTQTVAPVDTSGHFIRRILNTSPKEVEKALGKPDKPLVSSKDCDYLPICKNTTYQNGKYEALFYDNKLKWLEINRTDLYNSSAIQWLGFPKAEPTFSSDRCIFWRSAETRGTANGPLLTINGLRNISACSEWVIVSVDTYFKGKL